MRGPENRRDQTRFGIVFRRLRVDLDAAHHADLGVMQDLAMKDERAGGAGIAEVQAQLDGGERPR